MVETTRSEAVPGEGFRGLYDAIVRHPREGLYAEVLAPALPAARAWVAAWEPLRTLRSQPPGSCSPELLWELFALSVIHDHLLLPHAVSAAEYRTFFEALGFELRRFDAFEPLVHEIVLVHPTRRREPAIELGRCHGPTLLWGEMVFARGAVEVTCHPSSGIVAGVADRSVLYFAHDRAARACSDLSHGWGHNSMWRTRFHRFYRTASYAVFNADGRIDLSAQRLAGSQTQDAAPTIARRRELLIHRGFVSAPAPTPGANAWPYDDGLVLDAAHPSWPLRRQALRPLSALR